MGKIESWGPNYRIMFDLMIQSKGASELSSQLAFEDSNGSSIPAIFYNRNGHLHFINTVTGYKNYTVDKEIDLGKWYHIEIEQKSKNDKVR